MTIQAIKLVKRFGGQLVVDNVDFDVRDGEFVALLGPSGGGKSTVLRIVAGLEVPDSGSVLIDGKEVTRARVQDRGFGFVFQHYALFKNMSVRDNIAFGLSVRHVPKKEMHDRVTELLELVQMRGFDDRYPSQLSGGQRQRVALARALAPRPALLLLDEPFGALDAKVRVELRGWLRRLQREHGITSVFVTHDQEEAMELADRVVIIHQGRVEQVGTPEEVYDHPETAFVASFVGTSNVLTGVVAKGRAALGPMEVSAPGAARDGSDVRAYVRHHQVEVVGRADELTPAGLARATVRRVSRIGWVAKLDLLVDGGQALVAELPKNRLDELGISEGDQVTVNLRQASVFVDDYVSDYVI